MFGGDEKRLYLCQRMMNHLLITNISVPLKLGRVKY